MTVDKILSVLEKVNNINTLWQETTIKIEFGNEKFHTSIMNIAGFSEKTLCKATDVC